MKIVAICQCLDLAKRDLGITPAWWQILKGLHELGVEVVAVPYYGRAIQSLWWSVYENPNLWKNKAYDIVEGVATSLPLYKNKMDFRQSNQRVVNFLMRNFVRKKWIKHIKSLIKNEKDVSAVIVLTVPLNQTVGIPTMVKDEFGIPVVFFDGDTPTSLPSYGGLSFSYYYGAMPSEYDAFIINSKGAAGEVKKLGARKVFTVYWGVDPSAFCPIDGMEQVNDVGFYGIGSKLREEWIMRMLVGPSLKLPKSRFTICGTAFDLELGSVRLTNLGNFSYRHFCCQTKINLSIVRRPHAEVYASSTSRIFELGSLGCCIVSNPYNGIEEWFNVGKEVLVANEGEETFELYKWLLSDEDARIKMGNAARQRVAKEHTHKHRAQQILNILKTLT